MVEIIPNKGQSTIMRLILSFFSNIFIFFNENRHKDIKRRAVDQARLTLLVITNFIYSDSIFSICNTHTHTQTWVHPYRGIHTYVVMLQ